MTGLIVGFAGIVAVLVAQVPGTPAGDLAPYVSGGGAAVSVGGLIWVARQLATGRIVPRDVAETDRQLKALVEKVLERERRNMEKTLERERRLEQVCEASADRERTYHSMLLRGQPKRGQS